MFICRLGGFAVPKTDEKKMQEAIEALAQLNFEQLLVMQANLSEHVMNCYQLHAMKNRSGAEKAH